MSNNGSRSDAREFRHSLFNFSQFDTITAYLELSVHTPQIFQFTILVPADKVSRMVHFPSCDERTVREGLFCQFWPVPVALGHLATDMTKFTRNTTRQQMTFVIDNYRQGVRNRFSNGDIVICSLSIYLMECGAYRKFRRSITVV